MGNQAKAVTLYISRDGDVPRLYRYDLCYARGASAGTPLSINPSLASMLISDPPNTNMPLWVVNFPTHGRPKSQEVLRLEGVRFQEIWSHFMQGRMQGTGFAKFSILGSWRWARVDKVEDFVDCVST